MPSINLLLTMWLQQLELSRVLWSAFLHADETHIFYNMSSLLWKVREPY